MADQLVVLHLSDIHFRSWSGTAYDEDATLRKTLLQDAVAVKEQLGVPDGILITGDIAFSAESREYAAAKKWIEELCSVLGVSRARVWCVPGNHDIDQVVIKNSKLLRDIHRNLRAAPPTTLSTEIREYVKDAVAREIILTPLEEYNLFAAALGCSVGPDKPTWNKEFVLNDILLPISDKSVLS